MDNPPPIPPRPPGYELRSPANPPLPHTGQQHQNGAVPPPSSQGFQQQQQQQQGFPPPPAFPPQVQYQPHQQPYQPYQQQQQQPQNPQWGYGAPPPQPPPQGAPGEPTQWSPLFHADGTATPLFEAMIGAMFSKLDPRGTGYITPEVLSGFLAQNNFTKEEDIWKNNLIPNVMFQPEDMADFELKAACEAWPFDHKVVVRSPGRPQLPYGGMPLLSRRGLVEMMTVEHASDPGRACIAINKCLRVYGVWPALGPLPRAMLPPDMPPQIQRRIDEVRVRSQRAAREKLRANHVKNQLIAQGQQNALDLIDGPYYVRRYY